MTRLLVTTALAATLPVAAFAATCTPTGNPNELTCTVFGDNASVEINTDPGSTVVLSGGDGAVVVGSNSTVTIGIGNAIASIDGGIYARNQSGLSVSNAGSINGGSGRAIDTRDGTLFTISNSGEIRSAGADALDMGSGTGASAYAIIENAGFILSEDGKSLDVGDYVGVSQDASGEISASTEGIEAEHWFKLTNAGYIHAGEDAIQIGEFVEVVNTGRIVSEVNGDGIDMDSGTVINSGEIYGAGDQDGIDFDAGAAAGIIENTGRIEGWVGVLVEDGSGGAANTMSQIITNSGIIVGRSGVALYLGEGNDELTMLSGGELVGGADFGADDDILRIGGSFLGAIAGGAVLDGGEGFDYVDLTAFSVDDILSASQTDGVLALAIRGAGSDFSMNVRGWDLFNFSDADLDVIQLTAQAQVPLPATALLLGGAIAGLGLTRRR